MDLPKGVHVVRRGDRTYYYWRATKERLPDDPSSPEFREAIRKADAPDGGVIAPKSFDALCRDYRRSDGYRDLKPASRYYYDRVMNDLSAMGQIPVADLKRSTFLKMADALSDVPGMKRHFLTVSRVLMNFSVDREYREWSPLTNLKMPKLGSHKRWPDAAIDYALTHLAEPLRRACVLALYTGQREGDCTRMTWRQFDGDGIELIQEKTGAPLWIPAHRVLKAELLKWKAAATSTTILTTDAGVPWGKRSFAGRISEAISKHPPLDGLVFHGLRKAAAARLAEAGCSAFEIMSITGHASLKEVERYTREARQRGMASAAILKLESHRK